MGKAEGGSKQWFLEEKAAQDTRTVAGSLCWVLQGWRSNLCSLRSCVLLWSSAPADGGGAGKPPGEVGFELSRGTSAQRC